MDVDVIVDPTPVANPNNVAPIICSDEFTDITLQASVIGTTFTYKVVDPKGTGAVGGTGVIGDVISQQLFNTTQTPVTITYAITPCGPGATACPGATVFEDVTVNPLPITSAITGIDTVCEGTPNLVFSVVHTADSYYEWNVPAVLGHPTFGGSGLDSYAVIVLAANTPVSGDRFHLGLRDQPVWLYQGYHLSSHDHYSFPGDSRTLPVMLRFVRLPPIPTVCPTTREAPTSGLSRREPDLHRPIRPSTRWMSPSV